MQGILPAVIIPAGIPQQRAKAILPHIPSPERRINRVIIQALPGAAARISLPHPVRHIHSRGAAQHAQARPPGLAAATGQLHQAVTGHPVRRGLPVPVTDLPHHRGPLVP